MSGSIPRKERKLMLRDAKIFTRQGDYVTAGELYRDAGKLRRSQKSFLKGEAPIKAGEVALQRELPLEAAKIYNDAALFRKAAEAYTRGGDEVMGREMYLKQAELFLSESKHYLAAEMFEKAGDTEQAATLYEEAGFSEKSLNISIESGNQAKVAEIFENKGKFMDSGLNYLKAGLDKEAISSFQKVSEYEQGYFEAQGYIVDHFLSHNLIDIAETKLGEVLRHREVDKETRGLYYRLADLMEKTDQREKAADFFEKIVTFDINYKDVFERLKKLKGEP